MSTPIVGVTDFIPALEPYKPDLDFYSNVLQTKSAQYDAGYSKMSGLYSSVLNSPMLRDDNNKRRDEFLKAVDQDVKKVSGMDLSKQENVAAANTIFRPFYEDKNIIHDIAFTSKYQKELGRGESFRNCIDPDKCGGSYWEAGTQALNYKADEYRNADPKEALNISAPTYTPFINLTKKSMDAMKASGLKIEVDHKGTGKLAGYNITDTNGVLLLGDDKHAGPLPQFLYGMFGQDQAVLDMFQTQAYVQRKNFAKQNAMNPEYGSEANAESFYLHNLIKESIPKLEKNAANADAMLDELKLKKSILEKQGTPIPGSDQESSLNLINSLLENSDKVKAYHEGVLNEIKSAPNAGDLRALRARADGLVANSLLQHTLNTSAYTYAMGTAKTDMKADPFALAHYNTNENIRQHKAATIDDLGKYYKQKEYEKIEGIDSYAPSKQGGVGFGKIPFTSVDDILKQNRINPDNATPEQRKQAEDIAHGTNTKTDLAFGGGKQKTAYETNNLITSKSFETVNNARRGLVTKAVDLIKDKYIAAGQKGGTDSRNEMNQLYKDLANILQGTDVTPEQVFNSNVPVETAVGKSDKTVALASGFNKIASMINDPTSLWGKDMKGRNGKDITETLMNQGALSTILGAKKERMEQASLQVKTQYKNQLDQGKITPAQYKDVQDMYSVMTNDGLFVPQTIAADNYAKKKVEDFDKNIKFHLGDKTPMGKLQAEAKAALYDQSKKAFNERYLAERHAVEEKIPALISPSANETYGGAGAPVAAELWDVSSLHNIPQDALPNQVTTAIHQGNTGVVFKGNSLEDAKHNEAASVELQNLIQKYIDNKGKSGHNLGFSLKETRTDEMNYGNDKVIPSGVVYTYKFTPDAAKASFGKDATGDYTYQVFYPDDKDPLQTASKRDVRSPANIALAIKGGTLSVPLPGGNLTLTNTGDEFNMVGNYSHYNPNTGAMANQNFASTAPITTVPSLLMTQTARTINEAVAELNPKK